MSELKPYPKYKDSGVEWIGEIPEGWDVVAFNRVVRKVNNGISLPQINEKTNYHVTRIETISGGEVDYNKIGYVNGSERLKNYKLNEGDILFSHINSFKIVGNTALYKGNRVLYHGVNLLRIQSLETIDYTWLHYMLRTHYFKSNVQSIAQHAINQVSVPISKLKQLKVLKPSYVEQGKVKRFLNDQTSEIDSLVSDKKKLIELLEEKRQAVITETVTKGLDPTVKMKVSGIEWIGDIPDHWEVKRLKNVCEINPQKSEIYRNNINKVTFLPMENILSPGVVDYSLVKNLEDVYAGYTYFKNRDIVMAKVTPSFENNNIAILEGLTNGIGFGTTEFHVLRAMNEITTEYLYYLLRSERFKQEGVSSMYGVAGLQRIPTQFIRDYQIGIPNVEEQISITNYIITINTEIDTMTKKLNKTIELLKEYRESLIYEAVTGKIDLRDYEVENK